MKNHKINFFQSPNPRHFNLHHISEYKHYPSEDNQMPEDRLFSTPIKMNTQFANSPITPVDYYLTCPQMRNKRKTSEDIFGLQSHQHENIELQPMSDQGIKEKLEFSDHEQQELLIPITPIKTEKRREQEQFEETVRRQPQLHYTPANQLTPASQNRSNQRGLKKLAAQAYRFVLQQKKTTYKEVAKKLIEEVGEQSLVETNKRGEMNIKRRVYDALNVLIALGLLRRNGNKIMCKREEVQMSTENLSYARQRQRRRQLAMEQELANLRQVCQRKEDLLEQKRKLQIQMRQKLQSLKEITQKNKIMKEQQPFSKLQFPLLVLCYNKAPDSFSPKKQHITSRHIMHDEKEQESLKIWQSSPQNLLCSFNRHKNVSVLGEMDVLGLWRSEQRRERAQKLQKSRRRR